MDIKDVDPSLSLPLTLEWVTTYELKYTKYVYNSLLTPFGL